MDDLNDFSGLIIYINLTHYIKWIVYMYIFCQVLFINNPFRGDFLPGPGSICSYLLSLIKKGGRLPYRSLHFLNG